MSLAVENQSYPQQIATPAISPMHSLSNRNSNVYGDINIAPNARVHLGDVVQYIQTSNDPNVTTLPSQAMLDSFVHENIDLVERFDQRIRFLKSSIDSDNAAKSQALRNIGDEIRNLEYWMTQNKTKLERAQQSHDMYTAETTDAYVRILMAMNQTLHSVLDALASSLETQSRTEAERLEKEQMLKEIESSQQNISSSVDTACDSIQAAGKVMQVIPGAQRPEMQRAGKIMDDSAFGVRMFKKFAAFANKGREDENQASRGHGPSQHSHRSSVSHRPVRQERDREYMSTDNARIHSARQPIQSLSVNVHDDPSQRPTLPPRRSGQLHSTPSESPHGKTNPSFDNGGPTQNLKQGSFSNVRLSPPASAPRSRLLGDSDGWELQRLPPPPRRISPVSGLSSSRSGSTETEPQSHDNGLARVVSAPPIHPTQEAAAPPLPARTPKLPPRPSGPSREIFSDPGPYSTLENTRSTENAIIGDIATDSCEKNNDLTPGVAVPHHDAFQKFTKSATRLPKTLPVDSKMSRSKQEVLQPQPPPWSIVAPITLPNSPPSIRKPVVPCKPKRLASATSAVTNSVQTTTKQTSSSLEDQPIPKSDVAPISDESEAPLTFAQKKAMFANSGRQIRVAYVELK